ncbi:Adaptor_complexes medium subunit family protein [Hexamita inflata]|uniref:Adaptor complexes medium subunit family protein n=1 Tax=Hexamita inflata TaxID=28002 RepID=A0AA86RDP8_9EUKA|nr:Adaptor complexes medium subunit family protein [Hexamita inflata]
MIRSIFILNNQDILMERHYMQPVSREIPQNFALISSKYANKNEVPSVIIVNEVPVAHLSQDQLTFVAILGYDCNAYAPLQFLQRLTIIFNTYGGCTVDNIQDNYFILYQVLEEVCDGGYPLTTDMGVLTQIVPVTTSWKDEIDQFMKSNSKNTKTTSMQSNIIRDLPHEAMTVVWRPRDITHSMQSVTSTLIERLHVVCDESGLSKAINCQGTLELDCLLSGNPELNVTFVNHAPILDASLAKNVQITPWNRDKSLQLLPLDGPQVACCYKAIVDSNRLPLMTKVEQQLKNGRKEFIVSLNYLNVLPKNELGTPKIENICVTIPLADYDLQSETTNDGTTQMNLAEANRWIMWKAKLTDGRAQLVIRLEPRKVGHIARLPVVNVQYNITNYVASGLACNPISFTNNTGKIFQKYAGNVEVEIEVKN